MGLTAIGNFGDMMKRPCLDKTELVRVFREFPIDAQYDFTPGHANNKCKSPLLTTDEIKIHEENFCSIKPEHVLCKSTTGNSAVQEGVAMGSTGGNTNFLIMMTAGLCVGCMSFLACIFLMFKVMQKKR